MQVMQAYLGLWDFAAGYGMIKCLNTMLAGTVGMCLLLGIRHFRKNDGRALDLLLLILPVAFSAKNRLFYQGWMLWVSSEMYRYVLPIYGKLYFAVCVVLLFRMLLRQKRAGRYVRELPCWEEAGERRAVIEAITGRDLMPFGRRYLQRVKIYVTEREVSPFSGGILHPYVVMPRSMLREWTVQQRGLVLSHEFLHIRQGHILWLTMFELLKIYWWINPLVYLYVRKLRSDMEMSCDERCVVYAGTTPARYGSVMLRALEMLQGGSCRKGAEGVTSFVRRDDYGDMRRRLEGLAKLKPDKESRKGYRSRAVRFGLCFLLLCVLQGASSYPLYTRMKELVLYDEELNLLDYDSEELRNAACVRDGRLYLDGERFAELIAGRGIEGDYVYLSFDTIMKVPGCGGGGNVGMISLTDYDDIFYLAKECPENHIMVFLLKYFI